jgi:hypothetical protein
MKERSAAALLSFSLASRAMSVRFRAARRFALKHFAASALVAALCAGLVFLVWYPYPYSHLAGGRELFTLVVTVDVVMGPVLSLVVYNPAKPRTELWRDLGIIFLLQAAALAYGLHSVAQARPVYLAFEADRFRVVAVPDIDPEALGEAPAALRALSWTGPKLLGVRLLENTDSEYPQSIQLALQGIHPAFRPSRWVSYDSQRRMVIEAAKPVAALRRARPGDAPRIDLALRRAGLDDARVGYLPLLSHRHSDWVVLVDLADGAPAAMLPIDAWP